MDELKGNSEQNSLLNEAPTMSVDEPAAAAVGASVPVRMIRAALAGLAISGIGYAALASSPALSQQFTKLTGLSIVDQVAASSSCSSTCGMTPENECGGKCDSMTPYAEVSAEMSCAAGSCPTMSATLAAGDCCDATGSCCASSGEMAGTCPAGACPSETSANDVVEGEVAIGDAPAAPAVNEYLRAAQTLVEGEQSSAAVNE